MLTNDATDYYQRPEDLIFLLKHSPTIPNFGEENHDFDLIGAKICLKRRIHAHE